MEEIVERWSRMPVRERMGTGLRLLAFLLMVGLSILGYPPARAQEGMAAANTGRGATVEDALQDRDIAQSKADVIALRDIIRAQQIELIAQGKDIAGIEAELRMALGFLALLQGGGIYLSMKKKKED